MVQTADVVIVGGGVMGVSTAYHLARRGYKNIDLFEKNSLGSGSTELSAGGVRFQFSTEVNLNLSLASVPMIERFEEEMGEDPHLHQTGYLLMAKTEEEWAQFKLNVELQRKRGIPASALSAADVKELVPALTVTDILGATFCPRDGYADPHAIVQGFAKRARELGARLHENTEVTGIETKDGRVTAVETSKGRVETPWVVNAAGPWAGVVGKMAGVDVPVQPLRRIIYVTDAFPAISDPLPMVIDFHTGFYFRREGPGLIMGMGNDDEPYGFNLNMDWEWLGAVVEQAVETAPILEKARIMNGWAGLYEVSPDAHPIIGRVPELEGLLLLNGFSGHGFMHGPVGGKLISEIILDGKAKTVDISSLSYERFAKGELIREANVV